MFNTGAWATVGASGLLAPLVDVMAAVPAELTQGRSIYSFEGDASVDGLSVTKANMTSLKINVDSTVRTGAGSLIVFAVGKDAHYLRENSDLTLEGSGEEETGLLLGTGKLLSVFAKRQPTAKMYQLRTPSAVIRVRGTGLYAEAEPNQERSYICTCYGDVNIASTSDPDGSKDVLATHHDEPLYVYANKEAGGYIQAAPFKNHTDEELQLIETIVGRNTPYSSVMEAYPRPRIGY